MAKGANRDRFLVTALGELCRERGIALTSFSHDWVLRLEQRGRASHVYGYHFELDSATAQLIASDKAAVSDLLAHAGVPRVEHRLLLHPRLASYVGSEGNWEPVLAWARERGFPLVVKPNDGTGGEGVTRAGSPGELEAAVQRLFERHRALALSPYLAIEQEYRCVMLAGECLLAYAKERPAVVGDGTATTLDLVLAQAGADALAEADLTAADLVRVPAAGERVLLRWKHNIGGGARPQRLESGPTTAAVVALARRAIAVLGVELASVDVVEAGGELAVLELNTGIMLESYARTAPDGAETGKRIYGEILGRIFP